MIRDQRPAFVNYSRPAFAAFWVAAVLLALLGTARPAPAADAEPPGLAALLDPVFAEIHRTDSAGCSLGVYRHGELAYAKGYGMADLERGIPLSPGSVFDIGSTSKQFTAASLVLLAQQGKLALDDDIREHLPELPDYGRLITIRHLLHHTSGLRDYIELLLMVGEDIDDVTSGEEALRMLARQRGLNFAPGEEHLYSNSGYFLASLIVERASGMSLRKFARQHLFAPLGMEHTTFIDDHTEIIPGRAIGYSPGEDGELHRDVSYWEQNGDGAVFTTVEDLLQWDRNFYEPRVGGEGLVRELLGRGRLSSGETLDYALGLVHGEHRGRAIVSHGGSWGGYRAQLLRVPAERLSVAVLCNLGTASPTGYAKRVVDLILEGAAATPAGDDSGTAARNERETRVASADLARLPGHYRDPESASYGRIVREGDRLYYLEAGEEERHALRSLGDGRFQVLEVSGDLVFEAVLAEPGDPGRPFRLRLLYDGEPEGFLERYEPWEPSAAELARHAGRYFSPELETAYELAVEDGRLLARHRKHGTITLTPREEGAFAGDQRVLARVTFEPEDGDRSRAMLVSVGRIRDLRFEQQGGGGESE
jgi:CubicO group peptidase (beta-lactamase class C family)